MTKSPPKTAVKPQASKPRATFSAAAFGNLRAAAGEQGETLRILLADIDEDPAQPRQIFDEAGLASLAETIRLRGVLEPIVVRPPVNGRYMLRYGARRVRASRLAGLSDIPAVIDYGERGDYAAQIIENQHRAGLMNSELAAAIEQLAGEGHTNKQIAVICALKDYQVAAYRQVGQFPAELRSRLDTSDVRALYDLYRQWTKTPDRVLTALPPAEEGITVTEARRIIGSITGKATGSILDRAAGGPAPAPAPIVPAGTAARNVPEERPEGLHGASPHALADADQRAPDQSFSSVGGAGQGTLPQEDAPRPMNRAAALSAPVFLVALADGQVGRLVVDQRAEQPDRALVAYPTGVEEVDATALRIVRIE